MLRAGTETGSLINHLYSRYVGTQPEVGMAATVLFWSDRTPATVVELFKKGKYNYFVVQFDSYTRTDKNGMSDAQEYVYERNPEGTKLTYRINQDGSYTHVVFNRDTGRYTVSKGTGITLGIRERYYDFSF